MLNAEFECEKQRSAGPQSHSPVCTEPDSAELLIRKNAVTPTHHKSTIRNTAVSEPVVSSPTVSKVDRPSEAMRQAALLSTAILDSPPEPGYDAITRLAAEYFHADTVLLGFADEGRIWIKSYWGEPVREVASPSFHL